MHFNGQHIKGTCTIYVHGCISLVAMKTKLTETFLRNKQARANDVDSLNRFNNKLSHVQIQKIPSGVCGTRWVGLLTTLF